MIALIGVFETFDSGDTVFFRRPDGDPFADKLRLLTSAAGKRGPFVVLSQKPAINPEGHPQMVALGDADGRQLTVQYGNNQPEPLEVSGYWITSEDI